MIYLSKKPVLMTCVLGLLLLGACDKKSAPPEDAPASAQAPGDEPAERADEKAPGDEHAEEHAHVGQAPKTLDDLPDGVNAVQHEMRLLNEAMVAIFVMIANDQIEGVPAQIGKVHPAYELTHSAIEQGLYKPPKNADKMEGFEKLDHAFHDNLKALVQASKKDDVHLAAKVFGDLVQGCTECHAQYRY